MGSLLTTAPGTAGIVSISDLLAPVVQVFIMLVLPIILIFLFFCLQSFWQALFSSSPEEPNQQDSPESL